MKSDARALLLGWTLFGLSGSVHAAMLAHHVGRPVSAWSLLDPLVGALLWAALTPLAAWGVKTFPFERGRTVRAVLAFAIGGPVLVVLHLTLTRILFLNFGLGSLDLPFFVTGLLPNLRENFVRVLRVAWPYLAILHAVAGARRHREAALRTARLEAEVTEASLASERSGLNPAFLLATLDALGPLILRNRKAAQQVIVLLGDHLRARDDAAAGTHEDIEREIRRVTGLSSLSAPARPADS